MLHLNLPHSQYPIRLGRVFVPVLAGLVVLLAAACQPAIQVFQPEPAPRAVATVVPSPHALAVVGIDFDPPLQYDQIMAAGGVSLIAAVHNGGLYAESGVAITAQLFDPAGRGGATLLLDETVVIDSLEPGEISLVRFSQVTTLPLRGRYRLVLQVSAVDGELDATDNQRTYEIVVNGAR